MKQMIRDEVVIEEMIPRVMLIAGLIHTRSAFRWIHKAAIAVKQNLNLEQINERYKARDHKLSSLEALNELVKETV